jgi:aminopeptidase-like protein
MKEGAGREAVEAGNTGSLWERAAGLDAPALGEELHGWVRELYPIPRSLTGDGVRRTLEWARERLPLEIHEVASGTPVLDWAVPREWNVREAWLADPEGRRVADFERHNLHLVGYSVPVRERMPLARLRPHLHSLPEHPDWIPYRTSYYREDWGFCLPHQVLEALPEGEYTVHIDSRLEDGHLTYGELLLPGQEPGEILLSCHVCHPSLANDNLSGLAVATMLARILGEAPRRWSYRLLLIPGTIGSITWLARNRDGVGRIRGGLVLANLGDAGSFHYKRSRRGGAEIDRAVAHVLESSGEPYGVRPFVPWGYDERQYCSPGFDLPVGLFSRSPHGTFPEYHSSADDTDFVKPESLAGSVRRLLEVLSVLEGNRRLRNLSPYGEPQLGRRGLYRALGGGTEGRERELAMLWVLSLSDGEHSLLDIAERAGIPFDRLRRATADLEAAGLLEEIPQPAGARSTP